MDSTYQNMTDQAVGEDKLPAPLEPGALGLLIFIVITAAAIGFFFGVHSVTDDYTSCDLGVMEDRNASANAEGCQYIDDLRSSDAPLLLTPTKLPTPMPSTPMITDEDIAKAEEALRQQVGYDSATLGQLPEMRSKIVLATCAEVDEATLRAADKLLSDLEIGHGFVTDAPSLRTMRAGLCPEMTKKALSPPAPAH